MSLEHESEWITKFGGIPNHMRMTIQTNMNESYTCIYVPADQPSILSPSALLPRTNNASPMPLTGIDT